MLKSGSLDIFFPLSVDLPRIATASLHAVLAPSTLGLSASLPSVIVFPSVTAFASVWSSTGFWPPPVQDDQFFQEPIVNASPPGGGLFSIANVLVAPADIVK